jgi:hypothetical protein
MRILLVALALGATACAETPKEAATRAASADKTRAALDRELAGLVPGAPQSCLETFQRRAGGVKAFGETLVFQGQGRTRYVTVAAGCERVGDNDYLITQTPSTRLCRGDIGLAINRTAQFQNGGCSMGDFTPYTLPSR